MPRPLPRFPEPDTEPFWKATKRHELTYQTCDQDGTIIFPPRQHCSGCGSTQTTWRTSKGGGTVYSYSVVRQNRNPAFKDLGAYAIAFVDLDEGFRMMSNIVGVDDPTRDIRVGMRVRVQWEDQPDSEVSLPLFAPA
jgi:uncharacterized OB-fold protein